jgi:hypothetical protein
LGLLLVAFLGDASCFPCFFCWFYALLVNGCGLLVGLLLALLVAGRVHTGIVGCGLLGFATFTVGMLLVCSWVMLLCILGFVLLWLWEPVPLLFLFWEPVPPFVSCFQLQVVFCFASPCLLAWFGC